jgi:hypothetical protein
MVELEILELAETSPLIVYSDLNKVSDLPPDKKYAYACYVTFACICFLTFVALLYITCKVIKKVGFTDIVFPLMLVML